MIRRLLLLGLLMGGAAFGAEEARAVAVLDAGRSVAPTTPDPALAPVGFRRHGSHRSFHKGLHAPRSFAGKRFGHGRAVRKGFGGPRFFASKSFQPRARSRFIDPGDFPGKRPRFGGFNVTKEFVGPRLFSSKRFGHDDLIVRKGFVGPQLFLRQRFTDGDLIIIITNRTVGRQLVFGKRFKNAGVVVSKGLVGAQLFHGARFGEGGVLVRKGVVGKRLGPRLLGRPLHRARR